MRGETAKTKKSKHTVLRVFKYLLISLLLFTIFSIIFVVSYVYGIDEWKNFSPAEIAKMDESLKLYDADGNQYLNLYNTENRTYVSIDQIPEHVRDAFIAIEDARFYEHNGIDLVRIGSAFIEDIKSGTLKQGASTISQQLIKLSSLTTDQNVSRKFAEMMMAFKLEQTYSKNQILELYLNYVYFGASAYGIEAAAETYFSKSVSELTISEAALLAGVLKSTSNYAPHINYNKSIARRNLVLNAMLEYGFITQSEYDEAKSEKIVLHMTDRKAYPYGYYTDMVLGEAEDILNVSSSELLSGGYRIYTSLDTDLQSKLQQLSADPSNFPKNSVTGDPVEGAIVVLDSNTGQIAAIMGGREHTTRRALNRAVSMRRQPGSTIKPVLVYAPAIEYKGYTASTFVLDQKQDFNGYTPRDSGSSYKGWITVRDALALSINIPAVSIFNNIGVTTGMNYASNVGIPFAEADNNLSIALGGFTNGITPLELSGAYLPFSNGGYYTHPYSITRITDAKGNVLYQNSQKMYNVLSSETSFLVSSILNSCVEYGTAKRVAIDTVPLCAKTGTSTYDDAVNNKDAWIVSYNSDYIVSCWMGFDKTDEQHSLEKGTTGGTYPAELAKKIFSYLYKGKTGPELTVPSGVTKVKIDKRSLTELHVAARAGIFAPEEECTYEYYTKATIPTQTADFWDIPEPPDDFTLVSGGGGYPILSFTPKNAETIYVLRRRELFTNKTVELARFTGSTEKAYYTDYSVVAGSTYLYTIVPVLKSNQNKYEGAASEAMSYTYSREITPP